MVTTPKQAIQLAHHLQDPVRRTPVVVVTTEHGSSAVLFDVDRLTADLAGLTEVVVLRTGLASRAFAAELPQRAEVYGGAARVYPATLEWVQEVTAPRLHLARGAAGIQARTAELLRDAYRYVPGRSVGSSGGPDPTEASGTVRSVSEQAGYAVVDCDDGSTLMVRDVDAVASVAMDRVVSVGMQVSGTVTGSPTAALRTLDLRSAVRMPGDALDGYRPGDVVLARVEQVGPDHVLVTVYPGVRVDVPAPAVTGNSLYDLTDLYTPGEIVVVRVVSRDPWSVSMNDVDDDEEPATAPSLLPGGPAWLVPPAPHGATSARDTAADAADAEARAVRQPWRAAPPASRIAATDQPVLTRPETDVTGQPGAAPAGDQAPEVEPDGDTAGTLDQVVADLRGRLAAVEEQLRRAQRDARSATAEARAASREAAEALRARQVAQDEAKALRRKLRDAFKAARAKDQEPSVIVTLPDAAGLFADPAEAFDLEVRMSWAQRVAREDKERFPLLSYRLGPGFLDTVASLEGISRPRIVDVVVDVLCGRVAAMHARGVHAYRESDGPGARQLTRGDGAEAFRVYLQTNTPAARRLHFWRLPDGTIELWRVAAHDDHGN